MPLTVLNVAFPFVPVSPDAVGGAEQVLSMLDAALAREGHRSVVLACEGSKVRGELVPIPAGTDAQRDEVHASTRVLLERMTQLERPDVIHFHGIDVHRYLPARVRTALITLHLPPSWYPPEVFALPVRGVHLSCVSDSQARACPADAHVAAVISNGVDLRTHFPVAGDRTFLLSLGRVCPEKGFHHALRVAHALDVDFVLAGQVYGYEAHRRYFDEEIAPLLDARRRFIGPVNVETKRMLLSSARALLIPSLAPETSSLVAMEAMACGTPVIAFPSGALSEVVEHGRTGFLVDSENEMASAVESLGALPSGECRRVAERRFDRR